MISSDFTPQFVIVMGGAGSGKNHYIANNRILSTYKLIDVDAVKQQMDLTSAISAIKPMLTAAFEAGENVAHPTTGSSLVGQRNKIALAKKYGYHVTLVLIDTDPNVAVKQVAQRAAGGGHDVSLEAIISSNAKARANYNELSQLADAARVVSR